MVVQGQQTIRLSQCEQSIGAMQLTRVAEEVLFRTGVIAIVRHNSSGQPWRDEFDVTWRDGPHAKDSARRSPTTAILMGTASTSVSQLPWDAMR